MINVLLVDSDPENLKNFRSHLRGSFADLRIVGTFSDSSKDVIAHIRECSPHLIIADIRFFGGVRFMRFKDIHEEFPELRFIMYGTFNDSDYMKRAREFGVIDFMYRPVKPAELNRCIEQAISHFNRVNDKKEQKKILTQDYQERIHQYEDIFLRSLLDGHITRENEIAGGFSYFNIPFEKYFSIILLRIDHFRQVALTLSEMEKHILIFTMLRIVQEELHDLNAQAFIRGFNEVAVILCGDFSVEDKVQVCDAIKRAVYDQTDVRISAGVGRSYESPCDIAVSFREADAAFRYRYRIGFNTAIPIEYVEPGNAITYRYPMNRENKLVHSAVVGDYVYSRGVLAELFDALAQSGQIPDGLITKIIMTIVFGISRYISEQNLPVAREVLQYFPVSDIFNIHTLEDGYGFMDRGLKQFCAFINKYNEQDAARLHKAARDYVKDYFHENFSVAKAAAALNTTPEHLNKVFMDREKAPLFDYVMRARINEARELLSITDMDEESIAVKVGFEDVKYFRSIFKKYNGDEPREYRSKERA